MFDYEKLGVFYLGKQFDPARNAVTDTPILYDSSDLTTHAVCVGMTGSGKTGLCVALLEEALIDGIPVIAIDPKGDLANLALAFPNLSPDDFLPWLDEAQRTPEEAAKAASRWRDGLAQWGQSAERIARLRAAGDVVIFTPGSDAGEPLSLLRSFAPPADPNDLEGWRDAIEAAASGLLFLCGIDADPLRSRESLLLSQIFDQAWRAGRTLTLVDLIQAVQKPGFSAVGAFDLETFFPAKDRLQFALALNSLAASPSFAAWSTGQPLEIPRLLHDATGRPRIAVLSIAHLSDQERMFFCSLLLQELVSWMRKQSGSSSLRAILFMDELFGFLPPVGNPPSKKPLLTLLKQARAFGLGVVLATQNPVDLDYKALSNAGTWFLGRLQTERDKARVIEGLEGAAAAAQRSFDRAKLEATLAALQNRVFLLNNVHDDQPVVMQTRWALSFLRGPLTRQQISQLKQRGLQAGATAADSTVATPSKAPSAAPIATRPPAPAQMEELFLSAPRLRPALFGTVRVHYSLAKASIDRWEELNVIAPLGDSLAADPWGVATPAPEGLSPEPPGDASYQPLPGGLDAKAVAKLGDALEDWAYRCAELRLFRAPALKLGSNPGESDGEFRIRVAQKQRETRDLIKQELRDQFGPKRERLMAKLAAAEERVAREQQQARQSQVQSAISIGATLLGAFIGRRTFSAGTLGRAGTAARGVARSLKEQEDVGRASASIEQLQADLAALDRELQERLDAIAGPEVEIETTALKPKKADCQTLKVALAWIDLETGR